MTYARWSDATPDGFRFAVKIPKTISHENGLVDCRRLLTKFASEVAGLREKLGVVLLQLPPKQAFDPTVAEAFLNHYNGSFTVPVVIEPRHASWFDVSVDQWLTERRIARVAADPPIVPGALFPGGWRALSYFRWHGSPRRYYSSYDAVALEGLRDYLKQCAGPTWCMFDNTAAGAAFANAVTLTESLSSGR